MRIAVVDDNRDDAGYLVKHLEKYADEAGLDFETHVYADAVLFLNDYKYDYDLVVLDIDMPEINGIEAAKKLRDNGSCVTLMFVTNMPQYALESYSVEAADYVLKPIAYPDFRLKMKKALRYIERNRDHVLNLNTVNGYVRLMASDVCYVESRLHYLIYHTKAGDYRARGSLKDVEPILKPYHFLRCSSSYLVNLKYVEAIRGNDVTVGNDVLPISRGKKAEFMSGFTRYTGGIL